MGTGPQVVRSHLEVWRAATACGESVWAVLDGWCLGNLFLYSQEFLLTHPSLILGLKATHVKMSFWR